MRMPNGYGSVTKLSGNRRKPYIVRKTVGWHIDKERDKEVQDYQIIGYAATKSEGLQMLADFNKNPYDINAEKSTFSEVYEKWFEMKFKDDSKPSSTNGYKAAYKLCTNLYNKVFRDLRTLDLQYVVDTCGKNYPTLKKLKMLFNQLYDYAMKYDLCSKDYSDYIDIVQYKDRNPNTLNRHKIPSEDVEAIWDFAEDNKGSTILMLIYTGVRVSELLELKKENVHLAEQYFDVIASKTKNGIRKVPIADKVMPFFKKWYEDGDSEYLLHQKNNELIKYDNYLKHWFKPLMKGLGFNHSPHCCRHTCISMLAEAGVDQTTIKKIVGHTGAMTLTEKVYTHLDIKELVNAINKI